MSCSSKIDQAKFENLYRTAKAIQGSIEVGVSYDKFTELLQSLSTELSIANDKAKSEKERELLKSYSEVLACYHESAIVWKNRIDSDRYWYIPAREIFVEDELKPIVAKYSLPTKTHVFPYMKRKYQTIQGSSLQLIWEKAAERLAEANSLYYAK